ncbi:MAG TPA: tetratricopeptide repeat protein, partial [Candidatus Binataceae bacterium]|nr:tetratricopeptide repeat protein [Candidatus Binataceae bacterium]
ADRIAPNDPTNLREMALVEEALGDRKAAEHYLAGRVNRIRGPGAADYTELALAAAAAGDRTESEAALKSAAELPGGEDAAALARAEISYMRGDYRGAETVLNDLLKRDPGNVRALSALGAVLAHGKHYAEALAAYRKAAALTPGDPTIHYKIAVVLYELGRGDDARAECAIAIAAAPGNPEARALLASINQNVPASQ